MAPCTAASVHADCFTMMRKFGARLLSSFLARASLICFLLKMRTWGSRGCIAGSSQMTPTCVKWARSVWCDTAMLGRALALDLGFGFVPIRFPRALAAEKGTDVSSKLMSSGVRSSL